MKKFLMILVIILLFTMAGCSNENYIVGKWNGVTSDGSNVSAEFRTDKTVMINLGADTMNATYTYDDSSQKVEMDIAGEKANGTLEMTESTYTIILKDLYGNSWTLERIK